MIEVEEENLRLAANQFPTGNAYEQALNVGITLKNAGLNPMFFLDEQNSLIRVTTMEKLGGKLH